MRVLAALDDCPRPGREPVITDEVADLHGRSACRKARDLGHSHELWTTRLLAMHIREHGPKAGHDRLSMLAQGTAHKVRYDLERLDPEFDAKMAEVSCVCREVQVIAVVSRFLDQLNAGLASVSGLIRLAIGCRSSRPYDNRTLRNAASGRSWQSHCPNLRDVMAIELPSGGTQSPWTGREAPVISVIIPHYNDLANLERCIGSARRSNPAAREV